MGVTADMLAGVRTIVCHENADGVPCPDGMASAILLADALPGRTMKFASYGTTLKAIPVEPGILFCDICPEPEQAKDFVAAGAIVLDHHESREEIVAMFGERGVYGDNAKYESGAFLAFREVWRQQLNRKMTDMHSRRNGALEFARLAGIRDTWHPTHPKWRAASAQAAALAFYDWPTFAALTDPFAREPHYEVSLAHDMPIRVRISPLLDIGEPLIKKRLAHVAKLVDQLGTFQLVPSPKGGSLRVVMANVFASVDTSEVAEAFGDRVDLVVGYRVLPGTLKVVVSFRTCMDWLDVAALAAVHGGGGHTASAGFSFAGNGWPEDDIRSRLNESLAKVLA